VSNSAAEWIDVSELKPWAENPRVNDHAVEEVAASIKRFGFGAPVVARLEDNMIIAGHTRVKAAQSLNLDKIPVRFLDLDLVDAKLLALADNRVAEVASWDDQILQRVLVDLKDQGADLKDSGFSPDQLSAFIEDLAHPNDDHWIEGGGSNGALAEKFGVPPFSVIDSNRGYWRARKKRWLELGIESHKGRDGFESATFSKGKFKGYAGIEYKGGGSVFDPVLCEVLYKWFNVPNGTIIDPFAGGSVRGLIASALGYPYIGHELRPEQVAENRKQFMDVGELRNWEPTPIWIEGDSAQTILQYTEEVDMVFSCPPYAFLEVYSDDPADISNMSYDDFLVAYRAIIKASCDRLSDNRFACFVIGEVRDKDGGYINLVGDTIKAFMDAGMEYYNEIVYVTPIGSLCLRAGRDFSAGRKIGKTHQNVVVFYKGDPKKATHHWRDVEIKMASAEEYYED